MKSLLSYYYLLRYKYLNMSIFFFKYIYLKGKLLLTSFYYKKNIVEKSSIQKIESDKKKIFIIGSSPSILNLEANQKIEMKNNTTIAMNRYILAWEKVGIWPNYIFLHDYDNINFNLFFKIFEKIFEENSKKNLKLPVFIGPIFFKNCLPKGYPKILYKSFGRNKQFAESFDENIFFSYGSLTALINVIILKKISKHIILAGCDLNKKGLFFENTIDKKFIFKSDNNEQHSTLKKNTHNENIFSNWNILDDKLKQYGVELFSIENDSEFIKNNFAKLYNPNYTT